MAFFPCPLGGTTVGRVGVDGVLLTVLLISLSSCSMLVTPTASTSQNSIKCGPSGAITLAGSATVSSVAQAWATSYQKACGNSVKVLGGGDDTTGAKRVCGVTSAGAAVDVGLLSREFTSREAVPVQVVTAGSKGYTHQCAQGIKTRRMTQVDAAIDGAAFVAIRNGIAAKCIARLPGGGLTIGQLRWIYSNYNLAQLYNTGLSRSAVPNSDRNDNTHYWSELCNARAVNSTCAQYCPATEIKFAGSPAGSSLYRLVVTKLLLDAARGEGIATSRHYYSDSSNNPANELVYLQSNIEAIGFFGFEYYGAHDSNLFTIPLQPATTDPNYYSPTADTIGNGVYPMERRLYMQVRSDDATTLARLQGFFAFAYSSQGNALVQSAGLLPISNLDRILMLSRLNATGGVNLRSVTCGPPGRIVIAGSATVYPVAKIWSFIYNAACGNNFTLVEGPSTLGAQRVCKWPGFQSVDIADMSRPFKSSEAVVQSDTFTFKCVSPGNPSRSARQLPVAIDGITIAFALDGVAAKCISSLKGLTVDQLRWIFSNFTRAQLIASGWDPDSVPNSDGNDNTHFWSELGGSNCPAVEIRIAGSPSNSGTFEFLTSVILKSQATGESVATNRATGYFSVPQDDPNAVVQYIRLYNSAVGFFGYAYYDFNNATVGAAAIQNSKGVYVHPTPSNIADDSYNPFSRRVFMNLNTALFSMENTAPFIKFGYTNNGDFLVRATGLSPIPNNQQTVYANQRLKRIPLHCFSPRSKVDVQNKGIMMLQDVKLGDYVMNAYGQYDRVYSWAHFAPQMEAVFLQIHVTGMMEPLELSPNHMLFVVVQASEGARLGTTKVVPASSLAKGDQVSLVGTKVSLATIQSIQRVVRQGAFAPFTMSGTVAVNHIACSVYVDLQRGNPPGVLVLGGHPTPISTHFASHVFQSSHRIFCMVASFCRKETHDERGISTWVTSQLAVFERWLLQQQSQNTKLLSSIVILPLLGISYVLSCAELVIIYRMMWVIPLVAYWWALSRRRQLKATTTSKKVES